MGDLFEALLPGSESENKRSIVNQPWWAEEGAETDPSRKRDHKETRTQSSTTTTHALLSSSEDEDVVTINIDDEIESNNSNNKKSKANLWWLEDDDKESNDHGKQQSMDWEKLDSSDVLDSETDDSGPSKFPLLFSILMFLSSGVLNVIYGKLQMIPMVSLSIIKPIFKSLYGIDYRNRINLSISHVQIPSFINAYLPN